MIVPLLVNPAAVVSEPPMIESAAPAATVRLLTDSASPAWIVTVAPLVAIETAVAEVGTALLF